jgi:CIC family chloride channel protein
MVAVLAGAAHAPITAILLGWQLAGGEVHILPALVIAALVARWVAGRLDPASIYTARLERQGLRLRAGYDAAVLDTLTLADVLGSTEPVPFPRTDEPALAQVPIAAPGDSLAQALQVLDQAEADRLLVTDPALPGRLLGVVRRADIEDAYRRANET